MSQGSKAVGEVIFIDCGSIRHIMKTAGIWETIGGSYGRIGYGGQYVVAIGEWDMEDNMLAIGEWDMGDNML